MNLSVFRRKILIFDFWATIWSQRPQNTSTDSLDVFWQDSKKIFMFPPFFENFHLGMLRSFMLNLQNGLPKGLVHRAKIGCQTKNMDFFKVGDTLTMLWLGEKKHLSDVSSWLKWFYGHLRGLRDNLKILHIQTSVASCIQVCYRMSQLCLSEILKYMKFSNFL